MKKQGMGHREIARWREEQAQRRIESRARMHEAVQLEMDIGLPRIVLCPLCWGTGRKGGHPCPRCKGRGVTEQRSDMSSHHEEEGGDNNG